MLCMKYDNIQQGQFIRKSPAPFNPNPVWPKGYFEVLAEAGVPEKERPFFAYWVRQFFNCNPGRSRRSLGATELQIFLEVLRNDAAIMEWQIAQAEKALILYYEQFRGVVLGDMLELNNQQKPTDDKEAKQAQSVPPPRRINPTGSVPEPPEPHRSERCVNMSALRDAVQKALRVEHYALKTEQGYWQWIRRFVAYHHSREPNNMGAPEIHAFLSHLALNEGVAASTQNQALYAIVFLYKKVLQKDVGDFSDFPRAGMGKRLPVVCSREEVQRLFSYVDGIEGTVIRLLYGTGMRIMEALQLRVQDITFRRSYRGWILLR